MNDQHPSVSTIDVSSVVKTDTLKAELPFTTMWFSKQCVENDSNGSAIVKSLKNTTAIMYSSAQLQDWD